MYQIIQKDSANITNPVSSMAKTKVWHLLPHVEESFSKSDYCYSCCSNVLNRTWSWHVTWHLECWMTSFYIYRASRVNHRTRFVSLSVSCDISLFFHSIQIFDPVKINLHHIQILKSSSQLHQLRKLSLLKNNGLMKMWKKMM
jgi:hypothetical protein